MNYWGNKDTSVTFCEDAYVKSEYIAEYYNTISGTIYILVALPYLNSDVKIISYISILLGLGTIMLHMTQRFYGQICDELSMLSLCYLILNKINNKKYNKKILLFLIVFYIQNYKIFIVFLTLFTSLILFIIYESKNVKNKKYNRNIFLVSMMLGSTFWIIDQNFCSYVKSYNLHSLWHICTGVGIFCGLNLLND